MPPDNPSPLLGHSSSEASPLHPHEPEIPPALDSEGRCLVCALIVDLDKHRKLLQIAREAIRYAFEDHHLDGDECLCDAARSTLAAGLSLTQGPSHA